MTYCLVQRRIQKRVKHLRWSFCKNSRKYVHCRKSIHTQSFSVPCFPVFSPNTGKYGPEKLRIWTLFTNVSFILEVLLDSEYAFKDAHIPAKQGSGKFFRTYWLMIFVRMNWSMRLSDLWWSASAKIVNG